MAMKVVMGTKSGKTFQRELSAEEAEALSGRVLGEELNGEVLGYSGVKFLIAGGSDDSGFPMRKDVAGVNKKRILVAKSIGFRGKLNKRRFSGLRIKKTVAGNTISKKTNQVNLKVVKGDDVILKSFAPAEPEKAESAPASE